MHLSVYELPLLAAAESQVICPMSLHKCVNVVLNLTVEILFLFFASRMEVQRKEELQEQLKFILI